MDWIRSAKKGDKKAIEELYIKCIPFIKSICNNYYVRGYDNEDLQQMAAIVFLKVINKFNIEDMQKLEYKYSNNSYIITKREKVIASDIEWIKFLAYLKRAIKNRIIDEIRKEEKKIYINYSKDSIYKSESINLKRNSKNRQQVDLDKCISSNFLLYLKVIPSLENQYIEKERQKEIRDILNGLSIKERKLINYIYNEGISLMEYSKRENTSYDNVYYFRKKLLNKLKILLVNI